MMATKTRAEKMAGCASLEELDGFLAACRQFGAPLTEEETKLAQTMRARFLEGRGQ